MVALDETFVLSIWLEVMFYGLYLGLFSSSLYIIVRKRSYRTRSSEVFFYAILFMFFLATSHLSMNLYRMLKGYVWQRESPGGPPAYFVDLARWDNISKDTIYATQSFVGDSLAIYRCFLVWDKNYYIIAFPVILLLCSTFSGYLVAWLFTTVANSSIFSPRLNSWIITFYSLSLAQNTITTGLIAFHIWRKNRESHILAGRKSVTPIIRIIIESAAIYLLTELVLVVLYMTHNPAQYIVLEASTPIIGIVFTSIPLRLALQNRTSHGQSNTMTTIGGTHHGTVAVSVPMNSLTVHIERYTTKDSDCESNMHCRGQDLDATEA